MNQQQLTKLFDPKNLVALEFLAGEDTDIVLAVWLRMLTLAANDPEGCVRLTPGLHMEPAELAAYFHCTPEALEVTLQILEQLQQLTRDPDGTLKLIACAGLCRRSKIKKTAAANIDATEKETEKEKRKEPKEKSKEKKKKGDIAAAIADAREPAEAEAKAETQPGAAAAETQPAAYATQQPKSKNNRLIPAEQLPEPAQKIVTAWNGLPLDNKFDGLYPAMLKQLQALLERYGEEALHKAIANVAKSPFLLGNSRNNRGWAISLGWMLNPEHLENILQGKYQDKKSRGDSLLFQPGDEQTPYGNGFIGTVVD